MCNIQSHTTEEFNVKKRQQAKEIPFPLSPSVVSQQKPQKPFLGVGSMKFQSSLLRNELSAEVTTSLDCPTRSDRESPGRLRS